MKRSILMGCAGLAVCSAAMAQDVAHASPANSAVKRMYVNMRTGERQVTEVTARIGAEVWGYDPAVDGAGFYFGAWGDGGAAGFADTEIWDSGALAQTTVIDGIELWYNPTGTQTVDATLPLIFAVSDDYELCSGVYPTLTSGGFQDAAAPADPSFSWIMQYDLAGFEFTINGDGTDFGYAYFIDAANASEPIGATGPIIVNDNATTAPGAQDAWEGLPDTAGGFGCFWFGGYTPDLDPADPAYNPFGQFYIKLFGQGGCPADFNGDGFLDFFDYDDYVNCFETGNCPDGRTADFNGDGFPDFFDYDDFVGAFEAGC